MFHSNTHLKVLCCTKQQYYREVQWSPLSSKSGEEELLLNRRKLLGEAGATVCCSRLGGERKKEHKKQTTGEGLTANLGWSSFSIKMSSLPLINIHNPGRKWGKAALAPSFPRCLPAEVNTLIRNKIHERKGVGFVSPGPWSSAASCSRLFSSSVLVWFCKRSQTALLSAEKWLNLWLNCFTLIGAVRRVCTIIVYNCWASDATITLYEYMSRLKDKPHWGSVVQMRLTDALLQLLLTLLCQVT